jgi:hypothetical protein
MKKEIRVKTSQGWQAYKIHQSGKIFYCYERGSWSDNKVGETRSYEDAVFLIKTDARKYGEVEEVKA